MKKQLEKSLMYAITPIFADEIRAYVNEVKEKTGIPKSRIITNIIIEKIRGQKIFQKNIGNIGNIENK